MTTADQPEVRARPDDDDATRPIQPAGDPDHSRAGSLVSGVPAPIRTTPPPDQAAPSAASPAAGRTPRRARLQVRRVDPWSVLKVTALYSLCLLIVLLVAVAALYAVLSTMGVFDSLNTAIRDLTDSGGASSTGGLQVIFSAKRILLWTTLLGAVNVVLITALATLGAFLYNLCAEVSGGIEVTLAEQE